MAKVTFNKNDIQLSFNDTLERINLPGVTAGGESGPWKNGTKITDVCGTAETAVIYWCPGPPGTPAKEPTTVNVIQPNKFPEGWQLHTTGPKPDASHTVTFEGAGREAASFGWLE